MLTNNEYFIQNKSAARSAQAHRAQTRFALTLTAAAEHLHHNGL
jgi:hypothetical protein